LWCTWSGGPSPGRSGLQQAHLHPPRCPGHGEVDVGAKDIDLLGLLAGRSASPLGIPRLGAPTLCSKATAESVTPGSRFQKQALVRTVALSSNLRATAGISARHLSQCLLSASCSGGLSAPASFTTRRSRAPVALQPARTGSWSRCRRPGAGLPGI
jgi:hypothetical protein